MLTAHVRADVDCGISRRVAELNDTGSLFGSWHVNGKTMLNRLVNGIRWVFTAEHLPRLQTVETEPELRTNFFQRLGVRDRTLPEREPNSDDARGRSLFAWLLSADSLPDEVSARTTHRRGRSRGPLAWLMAREELPEIAQEVASAPSRMPSWLIARDLLPTVESPPRKRQPGLLRHIVSPDRCPETRWTETQRPGGFIRNTLAPEDCPSTEVHDGSPSTERSFTSWLLARDECPLEERESRAGKGGFLQSLFSKRVR